MDIVLKIMGDVNISVSRSLVAITGMIEIFFAKFCIK